MKSKIPKEWATKTIGAIADTSSGTTPSRALQERYYENGTTAWVKTMDLNNSVIKETSERVTAKALSETSLTVYPPGTVLVAMYGGFQQIGRTGLLLIPAAVNQAIVAIQPKGNEVVPQYLLRVLNAKVSYWRSVASSSRKDPNITKGDVRKFPIAYPGEHEQRTIVKILLMFAQYRDTRKTKQPVSRKR